MKIYGIKININPFTWIFALFLIFAGYFLELSAIMLTVLIHEMSHIYIARKVNIEVMQIDIFPFGGTIVLDSVAFIRPDLEILIAFAGPMSNIFFSFFLVLISQLTGINIDYLLKINLEMAAFNLLPGLPLDGGRIVKSILSCFIGFNNAVLAMVYSSYAISFFMIYYSISTIYRGNKNFIFIIVAILLIIAAKREKSKAAFLHLRDAAYKKAEFLKRGIMSVNHIAVLEREELKKVINSFIPMKYHVIIVLDRDLREKFRVTETQLFDYAVKYGLNSNIGDIINIEK